MQNGWHSVHYNFKNVRELLNFVQQTQLSATKSFISDKAWFH